MNKLNSMRLLEANAVAYEVFQYDMRLRDAQAVAEAVGFPAEEVFKTLVVSSPASAKPVLVLLPSNTTLNLKKLAAALGEKKLALAAHATAEQLTGLQVGGISPLALMQKRWAVYLDQRAAAQANIVISAGQRGLQLRVETCGLVTLLGAEYLEVADEILDDFRARLT